jgi:hypothetical protein
MVPVRVLPSPSRPGTPTEALQALANLEFHCQRISRVGQPSLADRRLIQVTGWLRDYLLGRAGAGDRLLSLDQTACLLRVEDAALRRRVASGRLASLSSRGRLRIRVSDAVTELVEVQRTRNRVLATGASNVLAQPLSA